MWAWDPWRPAQTQHRHSPQLRGSTRSASPLPPPLLLGFLHYWRGSGSQPVANKRDGGELERVAMEQSQQVNARHSQSTGIPCRHPSKTEWSLTVGIKGRGGGWSDLISKGNNAVHKSFTMLQMMTDSVLFCREKKADFQPQTCSEFLNLLKRLCNCIFIPRQRLCVWQAFCSSKRFTVYIALLVWQAKRNHLQLQLKSQLKN